MQRGELRHVRLQQSHLDALRHVPVRERLWPRVRPLLGSTAQRRLQLVTSQLEKGARIMGALFLILRAGQTDVRHLGAAGIVIGWEPIQPVVDVPAGELGGALKDGFDRISTSLGHRLLVRQVAFAPLLTRFFVDVLEAPDFAKCVARSNHVRAKRDAGRSRLEDHHATRAADASAPG
jgi:hypothetical protein